MIFSNRLSNSFIACLLVFSPAFAVENDLHRRLVVTPDQSIALAVNGSGNGNFNDSRPKKSKLRKKFKLRGEKPDGGVFEVNVKESTPAITSATTTSTNGGRHMAVDDSDIATVLVADSEGETGTIALIAVDKKDGRVHGVVQKTGGEKRNFSQEKGKKVRLVEWVH